jgi:hypothetical protein
MGAYARAQNVLGEDADHLTLLSTKQFDASPLSSFACSVNTPRNRMRTTPQEEKVECPLFFEPRPPGR